MLIKHRHLFLRISRFVNGFAEYVFFFLLIVVNDLFSRRPRPSSAPLVSGLAPGEGGRERPLSALQLEQLHAWFCLHQKGWRRNIVPWPVSRRYMVMVEHTDGATTMVYLFSGTQSAIGFEKFKGGRFDAGWMSVPVIEVDGMIALLRQEL